MWQSDILLYCKIYLSRTSLQIHSLEIKDTGDSLATKKNRTATHLCHRGMGGIRGINCFIIQDYHQGLLLLCEQFFEQLNLLQQRTFKSMIYIHNSKKERHFKDPLL